LERALGVASGKRTMADGESGFYRQLLSDSYDCADRILQIGYLKMGMFGRLLQVVACADGHGRKRLDETLFERLAVSISARVSLDAKHSGRR